MMRSAPTGLLIVLAMVSLALAAPTFQAERSGYGESAKITTVERFPTSKRLAYAALSDLKLIDIVVDEVFPIDTGQNPETSGSDRASGKSKTPEKPMSLGRYIRAESGNGPYADCLPQAGQDVALWKTLDATNLVLAIAATENYNRGFMRRRLEEAATNAFGAVGVRLDPSLGLTQVRLSRARALLATHLPIPLDDRETVDFLKNDCNALQTTLWWLEDEIRKSQAQGHTPTLRELAQRYNGGSGASASEFPYALIVETAYHVLQQTSGNEYAEGGDSPFGVDPTYDAVACFYLDGTARRIVTERYAAMTPEGAMMVRDRATFGAVLTREGPLTYGAAAPHGWSGPLAVKMSDHMDRLIGLANGRWAGRAVRRLDARQNEQAQNVCHGLAPELADTTVLAFVGRPGPDVVAALSQTRSSEPSETEGEGGQ